MSNYYHKLMCKLCKHTSKEKVHYYIILTFNVYRCYYYINMYTGKFERLHIIIWLKKLRTTWYKLLIHAVLKNSFLKLIVLCGYLLIDYCDGVFYFESHNKI